MRGRTRLSKEDPTKVRLEAGECRLFTSGPSLAVVAIIALLGLILISWRATDLAEQVLTHQETEAVRHE